VIYEPQYALNADKTDYIAVLPPDTPKTRLAHPMPISMTFFAGPGDEPVLIKVGTAYEAATRHRTPPPAFGPVPLGRPADPTSEAQPRTSKDVAPPR
jgi:hypothetical protein